MVAGAASFTLAGERALRRPAALLYNLACAEANLGETDAAPSTWPRRARSSTTCATWRADDDLAVLRDDAAPQR